MLNESIRRGTAGPSLHSSQQSALKPTQNVAAAPNHTTDYSNGELRRSVFAKDPVPQSATDNANKEQTRTSQVINPCDSQLQSHKYDPANYGSPDTNYQMLSKPALLGSKGDLGSASLARSAEKHKTKINYPLIQERASNFEQRRGSREHFN